MKVGVICSGNGGAFKASHKILTNLSYELEFFVITDRACGVEEYLLNTGTAHKRIENSSNREFSVMAKELFDDFGGVELIILFYTRLITHELFNAYPVFNLHPSLLPAFKGFNAINQAYQAKSKYLGATLHRVNETVDGGEVICQSILPILPGWDENMLHKSSFMQRVYLTILLIILFRSKELICVSEKALIQQSKLTGNCRFNPELRDQKILDELIELDAMNETNVMLESKWQ